MSSDLHPLTLPDNGELSKTAEQPVEQATSPTPWLTILHWFDSWAGIENMKTDAAPATVDWLRAIPLITVHLICLGVFIVGLIAMAIVAQRG